MSTTELSTLSEFFQHSGVKYRLFDMGRRVSRLSADQFIKFERAQRPYPYPLQKKALFGVIFWDPAIVGKHYVWFLQFPLDEQGLLNQPARDEFLVMLLDRIGAAALAAADDTIEGALKDSPYSFTPREDKMAAFNAQATYSLGLQPSRYYQAARDYFTGSNSLSTWHNLGMQGVADFTVRLEPDEIAALIATIARLPDEPFMVLSTFLEHVEPKAAIVEVLAQKIDIELQEKTPNISRICASLRAASNSPATGLVDQMVTQLLTHPYSKNIEILAVVSGRIWRIFQQPKLCQHFIEQLVHNDAGYTGFSQLITDTIYMPGLREPVLQVLRDPQRSDQLSRYVERLLTKPAQH